MINYEYNVTTHLSRGRIKGWPYGNEDIYGDKSLLNNTWWEQNRKRGHAIVSKYHTPQPSIEHHIQTLQTKLFQGKHPMLGIHMRGTDKLKAGGRKTVSPKEYIRYIHSFHEKFPHGGIFVATDDSKMFQQLHDNNNNAIDQKKIEFASQSIQRKSGRNTIPFVVDHPDGQEMLGVEIMTDIYLLARCDYLLHGISSVVEAAMYINIGLHNNSLNLEYGEEEESRIIPWE